MRATNPAAYEQIEMRAALGRLPEWRGVPEDVDQGLLAIRLGKILGVPAHAVEDLPPEWRRNAIVSLEVERLLDEYAAKQRAKQAN